MFLYTGIRKGLKCLRNCQESGMTYYRMRSAVRAQGGARKTVEPPPRAPPLFTLRCRAPPPAGSWGSPISAGSVSCRTVPSPGQKKRWRLPTGKCQDCHWPLPRPPSKHHLPAPQPRREGSKEAFQFSTTGALRTAPQQAHTVLAPLLLTQLPKEEAVTAHGMK